MGAPKKCRRMGVKNCPMCSTGFYKKIAARKARHEGKKNLHA